MKVFPLRQLMRHPKKVKQLTAGGQAVRITDNGKPLWVIHPDGPVAADDPRRRERIEGELEVMLGERKSGVSGAALVAESRVL